MAPVRKFLILDDDEDNRFLTAHALRKGFPGARVLEAGTVEAALNFARTEALDGILTDHHLGSCDGVQFMQKLKESGLRCPVVMVTSSSDPAVHRRAHAAGALRVFGGASREFVSYFREYLGETRTE